MSELTQCRFKAAHHKYNYEFIYVYIKLLRWAYMHMQSVPKTTALFQRIIKNKKHCVELVSVHLQVCSITQKKVQATVTTYSSLSHWHAYHCIVKAHLVYGMSGMNTQRMEVCAETCKCNSPAYMNFLLCREFPPLPLARPIDHITLGG